jgi:hypothetical protein
MMGTDISTTEDFDLYSDYYAIPIKKSTPKKKSVIHYWKEPQMSSQKINQEQVENQDNEVEASRLADRALLLLSFKDTPSQNLHHVLQVLGIHSIEEKKSILQEIFRLIREGIVYVPKGLPLLIDHGIDNIKDVSEIDLVLLRPYDQLIAEIQRDISAFNNR